MSRTYVDTNVLVYAMGDEAHPRRAAARRTLMDAADEGELVTSVLTIDEFVWARKRASHMQRAVQDAKLLYTASGIRFLVLDTRQVEAGLDHIEAEGLGPRDALHLAACEAAGCTRILSDDSDFQHIPGLERIVP